MLTLKQTIIINGTTLEAGTEVTGYLNTPFNRENAEYAVVEVGNKSYYATSEEVEVFVDHERLKRFMLSSGLAPRMFDTYMNGSGWNGFEAPVFYACFEEYLKWEGNMLSKEASHHNWATPQHRVVHPVALPDWEDCFEVL